MIQLIVVLAVLGFGLYLITLIPMPAWVQKVIMGCAILGVVLWLLEHFGVNTGLHWR